MAHYICLPTLAALFFCFFVCFAILDCQGRLSCVPLVSFMNFLVCLFVFIMKKYYVCVFILVFIGDQAISLCR